MAKPKPETSPSDEAAGQLVSPRVRVVAPAGPRRRAGFSFGPAARILTVDDLGGRDQAEETVKLLLDDPMLSVSLVMDLDDAAESQPSAPAAE